MKYLAAGPVGEAFAKSAAARSAATAAAFRAFSAWKSSGERGEARAEAEYVEHF